MVLVSEVTSSFYRLPPLVLGGIGGAFIPCALLVYVSLPGLWNVEQASVCDPPLNQPSSRSPYSDLYETSRKTCTQEGRNAVLQRHDGLYVDGMTLVRPWSLHPDTYHFDPSLPLCQTPLALLQSLKLGLRQLAGNPSHGLQNPSEGNPNLRDPNDGSLDATNASRNPSYANANANQFVPHGCNYRWYKADEACEVLSRYSSITIVGDSLSRHLTQGLFLILTHDLVHGALPRLSPQRDLYRRCECDGQFSENLVCRSFAPTMFAMSDPKAYGVCSTQPDFSLTYQGHQLTGIPQFGHLCQSDPRPRLVFLQGGVHQQVDTALTIDGFVVPTMSHLHETVVACAGGPPAVKVVWSGLNSQATFLDVLYPHQSDAHATAFNQILSTFFRTTYDVDSLDFVNLTRNASVSDGFHYLSEVQLIKATYLLNLLDLWSEPPAVR